MEKDRRLERLERRLEKLERLERNQFRNNKFWLFTISLFIILGSVFAGSHYADQILTGTFLGNYSFAGVVNFTNATVIGINNINCSNLNGGEWIRVPGNSELETDDFCVMKYEAKNVSGVATSQVNGQPWVTIDQFEAYNKCHNLGDGYHLITDSEWVTIAREIEKTPSSWTGGSVGSGMIYRGNIGIDDIGSYNGSDPENSSDGINDKGKLTLSNGEEIWDFSGNVWEWTQTQMNNVDSDLNLNDYNWHQWTDIHYYYNLRSRNFSYNSSYGIGEVFVDNGNASDGGHIHILMRGGNWNRGIISGIYALDLHHSSSGIYLDVGFRCTYGKS